MCSLDLETATVWRETPRVARRPHRCDCCGKRIAPGKQYLEHFSVIGGSPVREAMCAPCDSARDDFASAHGQSPNPSYFAEVLSECVVGEDRSSPWRTMLAALLWRQRQAIKEGGA